MSTLTREDRRRIARRLRTDAQTAAPAKADVLREWADKLETEPERVAIAGRTLGTAGYAYSIIGFVETLRERDEAHEALRELASRLNNIIATKPEAELGVDWTHWREQARRALPIATRVLDGVERTHALVPLDATLFRCQGCGRERVVPGLGTLDTYGSYCSNHDADGSGELYVAVAHVVQSVAADCGEHVSEWPS
jgi:hypothetical protein